MYSVTAAIEEVLRQVHESPDGSIEEIRRLLTLEDHGDVSKLFAFADTVRAREVGDGIILRGLIEFSNRCGNDCFYCGLNGENTLLDRYLMDEGEIFESVERIRAAGIKTVVMQSGEDSDLDALWLARIIGRIKDFPGTAVTLSVGEKSRDEYRRWRDAGADRYLLKVETTDPGIYSAAHGGRGLDSRFKCLEWLFDCGYQTGSGLLIGLPGQTTESIARDILFLREMDFDMLAISPFIPHPDTPFAHNKPGDARLALNALAVTRIVTRNAHMPAATALGSAGGDHRWEALKCGANVLMPDFTPPEYSQLYTLYPGKASVGETFEKDMAHISQKGKKHRRRK
ncbi:MAG: [FeFe] hydrogenase H-cluster radical SAM maturase HydE [bacterium]